MEQADWSGDSVSAARAELLRQIEADVRMTAALTGVHELAPEIARAMVVVPRHEFVSAAQQSLAYENIPLPIGHGQTISQPFIVAIMSQLLRVRPGDVVLEIGTGCGYQAAVLAELGLLVYSVEIVPALAESAAASLARLGYANVTVRTDDGSQGWVEHAPFHAIIVTAGGRCVPPALIEQLHPGGRLVIPVGGYGFQSLTVIDKHADGTTAETCVLPVAFVPLVDRQT